MPGTWNNACLWNNHFVDTVMTTSAVHRVQLRRSMQTSTEKRNALRLIRQEYINGQGQAFAFEAHSIVVAIQGPRSEMSEF